MPQYKMTEIKELDESLVQLMEFIDKKTDEIQAKINTLKEQASEKPSEQDLKTKLVISAKENEALKKERQELAAKVIMLTQTVQELTKYDEVKTEDKV